jgi:hypothetical protein
MLKFMATALVQTTAELNALPVDHRLKGTTQLLGKVRCAVL